MSNGHDPTQLPCAYCKRNVVDTNALWDEGLAYHDNCYKLYLSNEIKQYQKKITLGTITLTESNRMQEIQGILNIIRENSKKVRLPGKTKSRNILRSGVPVFALPEADRKKFFENQKKVTEMNELLREARWKQEEIEAQEMKQISEENKPAFLLENKQKTGNGGDLKKP